LTVDRDLAATTILGDLRINRLTRELDRLCHVFVARHLPSAGHLRFVSSVLRLSIALERIGDYAETMSRTAVQLSAEPPPTVARDIQIMGEQSRRVLHDALRAFRERNVDLARTTAQAATRFLPSSDKFFADLVREGEAGSRPVNDLFAVMATFNRLERVIHQAKNICEEAVFCATGETKPQKKVDILFVDERNDGASHMAERYARKAFAACGAYRSAGYKAASTMNPDFVRFAEQNGLDLADAWPTPLVSLSDRLEEFDLVIDLDGQASAHLPRVPFHTTVVRWRIDTTAGPEQVYKALVPKVRELMELLRGHEAS
jgi:phosphate transport system protein